MATTFTNSEISKYIKSLEAGGLTGEALNNRIYEDAKKYGVTGAQLDQSMGWDAGTSNTWIDTNKGKSNRLLGGLGADVNSYTGLMSDAGVGAIRSDLTGITGSNPQEIALQQYQTAASKGYTDQQVSDALGYSMDDLNGWYAANGLDRLGGVDEEEPVSSNAVSSRSGRSNSWGAPENAAVAAQVDPTTMTVQGQLNGLLSRNNPLMQRAYYQGLDMANSRGLLNSSMAGEAAQAAMMDRALPIAQADSSTYYDQQLKNQGYANQFNLNDRQYLQQTERDEILHGYDMERDNNSFSNDMDRLAASTSANLQGAYLKSVDDLVSVYADRIAQVEFLQGVSAEDKRVMIDNLIKERDRDMQRYQVLYSNMPTLNLDWTTWDDFTMPGVFDLQETTTEGDA